MICNRALNNLSDRKLLLDLITTVSLFACLIVYPNTFQKPLYIYTCCSREWTIFKNGTQILSYEFYNLTEFKFTKKITKRIQKLLIEWTKIVSLSKSFQVLNCSDLYFLTLEFLISVHANFLHTSPNQGSNESLNARMSFNTIASSCVLLSISAPLIWHSISTLSIRKKGKMSLGALN